jgi:hypothetical protein
MRYNVTGAARKAFAVAVSEILNLPLRYCGMPTANYAVGGYTITKDGELIGAGGIGDADNAELITRIAQRRYIGTAVERSDTDMQVSDVPEEVASDKLAIEMPLEYFTDTALANLKKIVSGKAALIKKALGADSLPIDVTEHKLRFPWFTLNGIDGETDAYTRFVCAMCDMAKRQKRVAAKEREVVNEKFTMRLFLIRLGFIGPEFKAARKILLRNLTGNSSWKNGRPPERSAPCPAAAPEETEVEPYEK